MGIRVLGGNQTDFARNWTREGLDISDLFRSVIETTLDRAAIDPAQIESIHVGNAFGQLYTGQGHLGAMPATVVPELWGKPAMRHSSHNRSGESKHRSGPERSGTEGNNKKRKGGLRNRFQFPLCSARRRPFDLPSFPMKK